MSSSSGIVRFRLLGIPVAVRATFWLVAIVLGAGGGRPPSHVAVWVVILFMSVLVHELGHAAAFRAYGYPPHVVLHAMGGATAPRSPQPIAPGRDVLITLAGPAAGLALGAAVLALSAITDVASVHPLLDLAMTDALWVTFGLSALNLVPILPLDGGRVLLSSLQLSSGGRGDTAALWVSLVTAATAAAAAGTRGWWWATLLAVLFAGGNASALRQVRRTRPRNDLVAEGFRALEQGATLAASNRAREVLATKTDSQLRLEAGHLLVWTALLEGRLEEAAQAMAELPPDRGSTVLSESVARAAGGLEVAIDLLHQVFDAWPSDATGQYLVRGLLEGGRLDEALVVLGTSRAGVLGPDAAATVGAALFRAGRHEDAAHLAERSFAREPHPMLAYNAACCWARQGKLDEALTWLARAVGAGYTDRGELDADPDLAAVRNLPGYGELRRRLTS